MHLESKRAIHTSLFCNIQRLHFMRPPYFQSHKSTRSPFNLSLVAFNRIKLKLKVNLKSNLWAVTTAGLSYVLLTY